ncbi:hypothetical protein BDY19DRAFT_869623, partial [Irpex rosettiformis]
LRQEFRELELLDEITKLRYKNKLPEGVGGCTRNQLIASYRRKKGIHYIPKTMPSALKWSKQDEFQLSNSFDEAEWMIVKQNKTVDKNMQTLTLDNVSNYIPAQGNISTNTQKIKKSKTASNTNIIRNLHMPIGFVWNSATYSCAFDSLYTILL